MLTRSNLLILAISTIAVGSTACVLTTTNDSGGVGGTGATEGATSTTTAVTSTTATTATTTTTSVTSSSSSGGGCVGATGTGVPDSACDSANFPATCASDGMQPLAVAECHKGFSIYESGAFEALAACTANIPATTDDTCGANATTDAQTCVTNMYAATCSNQAAIDACEAVNTLCVNSGDNGFDNAACKSDLNPFNSTAITAYHDCIDAHNTDPCSSINQTCFDQVTAF